jgi:hypothetical protein
MKPLSSVHWYAHRLAAMSGAEVVHRVREQIRRMADRADRSAWRRFEVGDGPLIALPALRQVFQAPWPAAVAERASASATLLAAGRLPLLGRNWPEDTMRSHPPGLWFWDPISRTAWPAAERYAFDVVRSDGGRRDARYVWELNRLQFLHPPAALAIRSGDSEGARAAVDTVLAWADANPPCRGINWASGIELALRLVSVALVVAAAGDAIDPHARRRLRALVAAHGFWISRYPSLYSSANNHRLAEGLGLLVAALLAPDLAPASVWSAQGRMILVETGRSLFHADGIGAEQSPTYAAFALEMIALGALLDPAVLTAETRGWLARAGGALRTMLDDAGNTPRIGDDDEGRVISLPQEREPRYVASIVAGISGLLGAPELTPPARDPHLRDLLFHSPAAGSSAADGVHHFRDGGYTVIRETVAGHRAMIVFDHGPLGFSSIAAHGHADALAVWLHLDGVPVLIDAGTDHYASSGTWRERFRSTAAHNTVTINDASQSLTAGAFNWRHKANARVTAFSGARDWVITARHDGYARRFGVEHERTLRRVDGGFAIEDRLIGRTPGLAATGRLLVGPTFAASLAAPDTAVIEDARSVKLSLSVRGGSLSLEPSAPYSDGFGERSTAIALVFQLDQSEPSSTTTVRVG